MPLENIGAEERITRETMIGWVEHWGESYDDVRPDDGAVRLVGQSFYCTLVQLQHGAHDEQAQPRARAVAAVVAA